MKMSFILTQARNGELKSLSTKDKTDSVIADYINLGLIALYGRFSVVNKEAIIALKTAKTLYKLDGTDPDVTGISSPDDLMAVIEAYDELGDVPINDGNSSISIFTPSHNTIQIPTVETGAFMSIIYKANPVLIEFYDDITDPDDLEVSLPVQLLEPLLHYIGYRAHGSVDGNIQAENNTHYMRYVASCDRIEELGIMPTDGYTRSVGLNGFV